MDNAANSVRLNQRVFLISEWWLCVYSIAGLECHDPMTRKAQLDGYWNPRVRLPLRAQVRTICGHDKAHWHYYIMESVAYVLLCPLTTVTRILSV